MISKSKKAITKITKIVTNTKEYNDTYLFYGNKYELEFQLDSYDVIVLKKENNNKNVLFNVLLIEAIEYDDTIYQPANVDMKIIKEGIAELILNTNNSNNFNIYNIHKELKGEENVQ